MRFIIGNFGAEGFPSGGQIIKSNRIFKILSNEWIKCNTHSTISRRHLFVQILRGLILSNVIVLMPGRKSLALFILPLMLVRLVRRVPIFYVAIGGWQEDFFRYRIIRTLFSRAFDMAYMESLNQTYALNQMFGSSLFTYMPNVDFSTDYLKAHDDVSRTGERINILMISRLFKEKGIESVRMMADIINKYDLQITLTLAGPILDESTRVFIEEYGSLGLIKYVGTIKEKDVSGFISTFDCTLLPTVYSGEGFPGSVIDSFRAGVPVIVNNWKYLPEIVINKSCGYVIDFSCKQSVESILFDLDKQSLHNMRDSVLRRYQYFKNADRILWLKIL